MPLRRSVSALLVSVLCVAMLSAQNPPSTGGQRTMMRFNADSSVMLREIMTIVSYEGGALKIMMVPPADRRPEGMPAVDLQRGDEVGMAGGKRIKTVVELRAAYDASKPGEEFKLGVRRDGRPIVVSFTRKDEKDLPGGMMTMRTGPGDENSDVFPALGLMLRKKGNDVVIDEAMPHASKEFQKGDVVRSLNGSSLKNVADFAKALDATKVGDKLTFAIDRKGETIEVSFPRPEPRGGMRMMRSN
jgi:S1-C subfamily serine protease